MIPVCNVLTLVALLIISGATAHIWTVHEFGRRSDDDA